MRRIIPLLLLFLFVLLTLPAQAQEGYRLRVPTAEEYIERITEIATEQPSPLDWSTRTLYLNITYELFRRFPDLNTVDFAKILAAYDEMGVGMDGFFWGRGLWVEAMIAAWLAQNQPDLSGESVLSFADFRIRVTPRDFNNDGQDEYVLDVNKGQPTDRLVCGYQAEYVNYLVVQFTGDRYQFIPTPLYWEGYGEDHSFTNFGEGGQIELNFEDINADGLPEWLVLFGGETFGGPGMGYQNTGELYILGWRDGHLADLTRYTTEDGYPISATGYAEEAGVCHGPEPRDVSWEYINIDDDPALEILQHQQYLDNWDCEIRKTNVIGWDATEDHYVLIERTQDFPHQSRNCAQRQAEEAMWERDYPTAITHYEQARTLPPYYTYLDGDERQRYARYQQKRDQYLFARLGLAYILTEQPDKADELIQQLLQDDSLESEPLRYFAEALQSTTDDPFQACLAAYDVFTNHYAESVYGTTIETYTQDTPYVPENIGCDAPGMIKNRLAAHWFAPAETPLDVVESMGLGVYRTIHADFDDDGDEDWLIWLNNLMSPFAFVRTSEGYQISQPGMDPYHQADSLELFRLPENAGVSVVYFNSDEFVFQDTPPWWLVYMPFGGGIGESQDHCPELDDSPPAEMTIWRLNSAEWTKIFHKLICATSTTQAFPEGAGSGLLYSGEMVYQDLPITGDPESDQPVTYTHSYIWDSEAMAFLEEKEATTPTPEPTPQPEPFYRSSDEALRAGDYPAALTLLDNEISRNQDSYRENPYMLYARQFTRGFILEALNRPDEALAEYVAIYEAAPESAWGLLAALHFEKVE